jgi:hypothetical protein
LSFDAVTLSIGVAPAYRLLIFRRARRQWSIRFRVAAAIAIVGGSAIARPERCSNYRLASSMSGCTLTNTSIRRSCIATAS